MGRLRVVSKVTGDPKVTGKISLKQQKHQKLSKRYKKAFIISLLANLLLTTIILGMFYFKG